MDECEKIPRKMHPNVPSLAFLPSLPLSLPSFLLTNLSKKSARVLCRLGSALLSFLRFCQTHVPTTAEAITLRTRSVEMGG